ncbi:glycoside hydrolase family 1 protein [Patescibacteria group bacterium]|nr:glycoside hydrolase family 1 protein [Patescibacteria group bacterium]MBU1663690.1 glycoside hydrolase family 1 protein [Patescibacteria group bacterium]MBU1934327.1 glycoside hydrolase family 1 protein [Patescibacteria group bacterium]MBU2007737.1 glycoside hydrolase family 1 protein [Patescibacteria group bacterium]MBU2233639.1 glycoside hydrolase family 1 protein [Patescibacteria group bacterium]
MFKQVLKFPSGFLWGASTSAYQIEGGITNDWSEWEEKNADRLVKQAKLSWQPWQQEKFPEMFKRDNYLCGQACKSYELFGEDIKCLKELNCSAYRLSIEWARVEPEVGKFDKHVIEHYRLILKTLKENNIKVVLTLWHWTNPVWLVKEGSWESKKVRQYFNRYAQLIVNELGDLVDFWVTLNEPLMIIGHGYLDGKFPPNKKFSLALFKVFNNFVTVHKNCYKIIHNKYPSAQVSIAMTTGAFTPANKYNPIEILMVKIANYFRNDWYINRIKGYFDYIGVNWYHHNRLIWYPPFRKNLNEKITDMGWEIYPRGIYIVLKNYQKYKKPIYILENGIADTDDKLRANFIKDHLSYVHKAIGEGVEVCGYFYWSLLDNFEWDKGYWLKFGLYAVDHQTFKRTARPSAKIYAEICKNNQVKINIC